MVSRVTGIGFDTRSRPYISPSRCTIVSTSCTRPQGPKQHVMHPVFRSRSEMLYLCNTARRPMYPANSSRIPRPPQQTKSPKRDAFSTLIC